MSSNLSGENSLPWPNPESPTLGHPSARQDDHLFFELCSVNNELVDGWREMLRGKSEMAAVPTKIEASGQHESKEANN